MTNSLASAGQLRAGLIRIALVSVPLVVLLGSLSGRVAGTADNAWLEALAKPAVYPPGWLFGVAWTILYALMGLALAHILHARGSRGRGLAIGLFAVQLALNLAWAPLFFAAQQLQAAFWLLLVILAAAIATTVAFARIRPLAAWLLIPYLLWLGFAGVLCLRVWQLNPQADAAGAAVAGMQLPAR